MIITNMERCRGWLLFFERKGKMVRNEANSDSHRMQRSSDCGYLGDGYHQIHLPNWVLLILLRSMQSERQRLPKKWNCNDVMLDKYSEHCILRDCSEYSCISWCRKDSLSLWTLLKRLNIYLSVLASYPWHK